MRAKTVIYYTKSGEVKRIKSNAGQTRHNKAADVPIIGLIED